MLLTDFLSTWSLFKESYLLGWTFSVLLPLIGIIVILRGQIFVAVAVSHSSILGMAFFQFLLVTLNFHDHHHGNSVLQELIVMAFSLLASILCIRLPEKPFEQREVATVLVFILSTAFSYLLLSNTPIGLKEVHDRISSSLISSNMSEVWISILMTVFLIILVFKYHKEIYLICVEPITAKMMGYSILFWEILLSMIIGLGLGWCIHLAGWLFVFGTMIFPVYISIHLLKSFKQVLLFSPIIGLLLNVIGFILSHKFDYPYSQFSIAFMGSVLLFLKFFCKCTKWRFC